MTTAEANLAAIYKILITPTGHEPALRHFQRDFDAVRKISEPYYRAAIAHEIESKDNPTP